MCDKNYGGPRTAGRSAIDPGMQKAAHYAEEAPTLSLGPQVPTIYSLNQRIETARAELNSLLIARQFLQNETPNGEQVALGLTALRALGYSL